MGASTTIYARGETKSGKPQHNHLCSCEAIKAGPVGADTPSSNEKGGARWQRYPGPQSPRGMHACNELRIMEAMKCLPPTRHRTEKSGSKHPELRRIRPSTTTRHQVLTTASQSSIPACPVTSGTRRAAGSASPGRSHTTHRQPSITRCEPDRAPPAQIQLHPPPAAGHRTLPATPGSQTAATGLTPPTTDRDRSSEASCRTSIEPLHSQPLSSPRRILLSPSLSSPVRSFLGSPPTAGGLFRLTQPAGTDG